MAQQTIGIGSSANDGTGDPVRTAFDKVNDNFTEVYAYINGGAGIFPGVGGGATDNLAAWNSFISANDYVVIPVGEFLFSEPMYIPPFKRVIGSGILLTKIKGTSGQPCVIQLGTGTATGQETASSLSDVSVSGAADIAVSVDDCLRVYLENISVRGTFVDGFWLNDTFGASFVNLSTDGATISGACFTTDGYFNANRCSGWYTSNINCAVNILIEEGNANSFHGLTAQGGDIGVWVKGARHNSFTGLYTESVVLPLRLGDKANAILSQNNTFNGIVLTGPGGFNTNADDARACLELDNDIGTVINGLGLTGAFNADGQISVDFTGVGSGAEAVVRLNRDGTIHSVEVLRGGTGWSAGATVAFSGGTGSGATATAGVTGDAISSVTVTAPGSGYTPSGCPVCIRINQSIGGVINGIYSGTHDGLNSAIYPWIVQKTGATSSSSLTINNMQTRFTSQLEWSDMRKAGSFGSTHAITYLNSSGTPVTKIYTLPNYD